MAKKPKPRPRGRPPLEDGQDRSKILQVRLRPDELASLQEAAEKAGKPLSAWVRETLLERLERR